jgi:hypothetical protein
VGGHGVLEPLDDYVHDEIGLDDQADPGELDQAERR